MKYFKLSNNRAGWNKRAGWNFPPKLIIMQDGIKVQVGISTKMNKRAGWNKSAGWHFGVIGLLNSSITMQVLTNFLTKMFYFQPKSCLNYF